MSEQAGLDKLFAWLLAAGTTAVTGAAFIPEDDESRKWWIFIGVTGFIAAAAVSLYAHGIKRFWAWLDARTAVKVAASRRKRIEADSSYPDPAASPSPTGTLTIDVASYGIGEPEFWTDVTEKVRNMLVGNRLSITASHHILGIKDLKPGQEKRLDIEWSLDGVPQQKVFFVEDTGACLPLGDRNEWAALVYWYNGEKRIGPSQ